MQEDKGGVGEGFLFHLLVQFPDLNPELPYGAAGTGVETGVVPASAASSGQVSRKLDLGAKPGLEPRHCTMRCGHPEQNPSCSAKRKPLSYF